MKTVTRLIIAAAALTSSALAFAGAPQMVTRSEAVSLQKIGVVSSSGFSLDELDASLAMKAADAGATHYRVIGASGNNKLSGTAVLYR
ncbi:YdgH/BhsA/McbA-like domain containing protein [Klebsiella aerogenes]|uniref:YdgH/BhsA/McbA-like domain containing protein n=1 Tax=Klebsiella aerogenes TaxID=548 RepID=UPI002E35C6B4|nr:YdgH/BhsA/McbA-like domain containing protein [Klebsiella aerogenes]MED7793190.1 YdgH/BhsA/McbA-like domain containing protein [Klebsiella aerogenes]